MGNRTGHAPSGITRLQTAVFLLTGFWLTSGGAAENYPARPLRIIAPYGAGGSYDVIARIMAQKLSEQMEQQVVVDNRPGAMGRIGMELGVKAMPMVTP